MVAHKIVVCHTGENAALAKLKELGASVKISHYDRLAQRFTPNHIPTFFAPMWWGSDAQRNATVATVTLNYEYGTYGGSYLTAFGESYVRNKKGNNLDQFQRAVGRKIALYRAIDNTGWLDVDTQRELMLGLKADLIPEYAQYFDKE